MKRYIKSSTEEKVFTKEERIRLFGKYPKGEIVVPQGYEIIGESAFHHCYEITSVVLPDTVKIIGFCAFASCFRLESINIPDSVKEIGTWAFDNCDSLTSIMIPGSVTKIGSSAFSGCSHLVDVKFESDIDSISFGSSVFMGTPVENKILDDTISSHHENLRDDEYSEPVIDEYWSDLKNELFAEEEDGIDSIAEFTDSGNELLEHCYSVEGKMNLNLEPSMAGPVIIYNKVTGEEIDEVDYYELNTTIFNLAMESDTAEEFESKYEEYLKSMID